MERILMVGMHDKIGGVETFLMNYYRNIDKNKIQFDFVNMYNAMCFEDEIKQMGGNVYKVTNVKKNPIKYYKQLKRVIMEHKYSTIHINMLSMANVIPIIVAKKLKVKNIIVHSHNSATPHGILRKVMNKINKKIVIDNATKLFACSRKAGEWMFGKNKNFEVINNAIDIEKYKYNSQMREKIRENLGIKDKFVIGNIARFSEQKNHDFLIDVFKEVTKIDSSAVLMLIGEGELKKQIREKVEKQNLLDKVLFLDTVKNANDYYQAMDVFVLTSLFEGLPVVGIEAQASGTSCVFSNTITKELELTKFTKFIGLDKPANQWAKEIVELKNNRKNSINDTELIKKYDIVNEAQKLSDMYCKISRKKIMHVVYGLGNGGVENVIYNYFSRLNEDNEYELLIVTQNKPKEDTKSKFKKIGFSIYELPEKKKNILVYISRMKQILKNEKPDIIHCHMTMGNFLPNCIAFFCGVKVRISHSHFAYAKEDLKSFVYKECGKIFANRYMACTEDAAHYLFGKNIEQVYILKNAINLKKFHFDEDIRNAVRRKLNLTDKYVVGNVARFTKQKNHDFLIDLFNEIQKKEKNAVLLLVGEGEDKERIRNKINELGLNDKTVILENSQSVNELMMAMDVFLFPTLFEGLGIVLVEAQATGLKCISSDRVPVEELKLTNNIKFIKLEDDRKIWIDSVLEKNTIIRNQVDLKKFGENGYSIEKEVNKLKEYYKNI